MLHQAGTHLPHDPPPNQGTQVGLPTVHVLTKLRAGKGLIDLAQNKLIWWLHLPIPAPVSATGPSFSLGAAGSTTMAPSSSAHSLNAFVVRHCRKRLPIPAHRQAAARVLAAVQHSHARAAGQVIHPGRVAQGESKHAVATAGGRHGCLEILARPCICSPDLTSQVTDPQPLDTHPSSKLKRVPTHEPA